MDAISESRLVLIHSKVADDVRQLATMVQESINVECRVVQGLRSWDEQAALYSKGRVTPGEACYHDGTMRPVGACPEHPLGLVVTHCVAGHSWHQFGLAVDLAPGDLSAKGWQPDWNVWHPAWVKMKEVGLSLGFIEGAQFRTFPDNPHFQKTGRFPINPDDEVRQLFKDGGMQAVWDEAGI